MQTYLRMFQENMPSVLWCPLGSSSPCRTPWDWEHWLFHYRNSQQNSFQWEWKARRSRSIYPDCRRGLGYFLLDNSIL